MSKNIWRQVLAILFILLAFNFLYTAFSPKSPPASAAISYSRFRAELVAKNISVVTFQGTAIEGLFHHPVTLAVPPGVTPNNGRQTSTPEKSKPQSYSRFTTTLPPFNDPDLMSLLQKSGAVVNTKPKEEPSFWSTALLYIAPWILILGIWWFIIKGMRGKGGAGGGLMGNFAKSGAHLYSRENSQVTFNDVAGLAEAKQDLMEIVQFLRDPKKFTRIGGKVPRGVLLVGPPGTGKTLLARAVAGEAGVPFFSISASQFIEMFVGVGASRVRDLFGSAKKSAPSIIFIDELDAVGRSRGTGLGGGNDEREQTLNQLLSEMDGFDPHSEVVVMSATNRPDVLDAALMRPGRFDRQVVVERPDWRAREEILKVHTRQVPLDSDVDLRILARGTPGMCGADLESLVNEAALIAARDDSEKVSMDHLERAKDRILMGAERKLFLSAEEKRITAYHEAGHTLVACLSPGADPVHKVSIIPRGHALGVTQQLPMDDKYHYSKTYLQTRIAVSLGGRSAERAIFNDFSTGAESDLKQATDLAEKMVCQWGMSEKLGAMTFSRGEEHPFLGRKLATEKSFSEQMAWIIDQEIGKLIEQGEVTADRMIRENHSSLEALAQALLEEEVLEGARVDEILKAAGATVPTPGSNEEASVQA
jgi:cell division protease FtsH